MFYVLIAKYLNSYLQGSLKLYLLVGGLSCEGRQVSGRRAGVWMTKCCKVWWCPRPPTLTWCWELRLSGVHKLSAASHEVKGWLFLPAAGGQGSVCLDCWAWTVFLHCAVDVYPYNAVYLRCFHVHYTYLKSVCALFMRLMFNHYLNSLFFLKFVMYTNLM